MKTAGEHGVTSGVWEVIGLRSVLKMWRVKKLNLSLSPSPQPGKPAMRTPLRELTVQASTLGNSGKGSPVCHTRTSSLCKPGLQVRFAWPVSRLGSLPRLRTQRNRGPAL
ncbi:hypothetical protein MC885_010441, partial [Smutsia gigantea]